MNSAAVQSEQEIRSIRRVTWIGLVINVVLAGFKLAAGILGSSQVIVADAVHTLSDLTTDVLVLVGVSYWSRPPDERHPHGHGRIEALVTAAIGLALAAVAVGLTWNAVSTLRQPHARVPGLIALVAALVSVASKEALYRWTVSVGRRVHSTAVVANAWHHRSDALSSIPAALAVLTVRLYPDWLFLDHLGAVVVSVFIFQAAVMVTWPALGELIDVGASRRELTRIEQVAMSVQNVRDVHAIRTRIVGGRVHVDLHVLVDSAMTVGEGHAISEEVKRRLLEEGPRMADVVVHLEPDEEASRSAP